MKYQYSKLLNIPTYYQGTHDSLCTYYAGSMMLAALYPKFGPLFGKAKFDIGDFEIDDPIISRYLGPKRRGKASSLNQKNRNILSRWFFEGEDLKPLCTTLNSLVEHHKYSTNFEYTERTARNASL